VSPTTSQLGDAEVDRLYDEHGEGLAVIRALASVSDGVMLGESARDKVLRQSEIMEAHVAECGELFGTMGRIPPEEQDALFRHLLGLRKEAPRWTEVAAKAESKRDGACGAAGLPIIPHYAAVPPFDPLLGVGLVPGPSLLVEDHGGIQLAHESGADFVYSYRPLVLAGDGDMLAVYGARNPAFESYCREFLCLGHVRAMSPAAADPRWPPARACAEDGAFVGRLAEAARSPGGGGLNIVPYMATGDVWRLAGEIAQRAQVPVRVAAPPPTD
jgi:hypothetical protein